MNLFFYFFSILVPLSVLSGIAGTHIHIRGYHSLAGGVAHFFFGPFGLAYLFNFLTKLNIPLLYLVLPFVLPLIFFIPLKPSQNKSFDEQSQARINILWSLGMSVGLLIIFLIPSFINLESLLFGRILLVDNKTIVLLWLFALILVVLQVMFHNYFKYLPLYQEMQVEGYRPLFYHRIQLFICVVSILLILQAVGIVLLVTILTVPTLVASRFKGQYTMLLVLSILFEFVFLLGGVVLSFWIDVQTSPVIATFTLIVFLGVIASDTLLKHRRMKKNI